MSPDPASMHAHPSDGCEGLRAEVERACEAAKAARQAQELAAEHARALRRDLTTAQRRLDVARAAAAPERPAAEKAAARDRYQLARATAAGEAELREATAAYARAIDDVNRATRKAEREVHAARAHLASTEAATREGEQAEQAARMRAEQAGQACLDARVRLASCEEGREAAGAPDHADVFEPHAATGGHAVAISEAGTGAPLVIESMVSGDRLALALAAARVAENTGISPAEANLQLQELVDAIVSTASASGYLAFDIGHPFWSALTFEEARDVIAALDRLGFALEPTEGWHAGRAPAASDLSMALAYAGLDARNMRRLPTADDLRALPASIAVDARAFLVERAPELTVDSMVRILERRAAALEPLWNEWGHVRRILLSDRHSLGTSRG